MIPGWISGQVDVSFVDAPLPTPHRTFWREGGKIVRPFPDSPGPVTVRSAGGGAVHFRAGVDEEGRAAIEVELEIREVFHAFLVDRIEPRLSWSSCGNPGPSNWEPCE